jgi:phage terminase large subunit-like protein
VCGRDDRTPAHYFVLADLSLKASPGTWARVAVQAFHGCRADRIIVKQNFGGAMVQSVIRNVDPKVSFKSVVASRGKSVRTEPIASLCEPGRVHHCGTFSTLEDQMVGWDPVLSVDSSDRMDALVWALSELSESSRGILGLHQYWLNKAVKTGNVQDS